MSALTLEQKVDNIEKMLKTLLKSITSGTADPSQWVKAKAVMVITGWDVKELRRNRDFGLIKCRRKGKCVEYNIASIPAELIKKTAA